MELCTRNLFLLDTLRINSFIWRCWKDYTIVYRKNDQKCGAAVIGSFNATMPLPTRPWVCSSFWEKTTRRLYPILPIHLTLRQWLFSVPSYERPDKRETFCWCQWSEKENTGGLEQHQHGRDPEMFSAVGKMLVQVYQVKSIVLWRRLEL